jgi:hypothetical protein
VNRTVIVQSGGNVQIAVGGSGVTQIQTATNPFDQDLKGYVQFLYDNAVEDIENSTVWEMAEQYFGHDLEDEELQHVFKLLGSARVEVNVSWG